ARYLVQTGIAKEAGVGVKEEELEIADEVVREKEQPAITQVKSRMRPRFAGSYQPGQTCRKIAVTGMACRFPESPTLEAFWNNLKKGRDCISVVPPDRWDVEEYYSPDKNAPHKSYSKWAGFIDNIDAFDAEFFGIPDEDALVMDPQHRILMELTQELFDRAGYTKGELDNKKIGVYIGGAESSYIHENIDIIPPELMNHLMANKIQNMMAARISNFYNLTGNSMTIDTACSSSLVAIHEACKSIIYGECEGAIAGGIKILLDPYFHISFSKAGTLSDEINAYVFDQRSKGYVLGEGAGLVFLKDFEKAVRDGDRILGVINGSAVNNNGYTSSVTLPKVEGQKDVIQSVLQAGNINPESISYLEANGTGTLIGDPIEIKVATEVYRQYTNEKQYCAVGAVKPNIGHLLHASGIAGVIKILLMMQHKKIPPTLNCEKPHHWFKFESSPFYPASALQEWKEWCGIRRAAISSFGYGGTNCHMVLEAFNKKTTSFYEQKRNSLPTTRFNRKRYWLGEEISEVENEVIQISDEESQKQLLIKLQNGEITPEQLLALEGD
ncbi:MAG: hypothetical protein JXB88_13445, partial [Spirochaetales bacterium]|nr:hypothetical protein [Spirochaetales bacterium]